MGLVLERQQHQKRFRNFAKNQTKAHLMREDGTLELKGSESSLESQLRRVTGQAVIFDSDSTESNIEEILQFHCDEYG